MKRSLSPFSLSCYWLRLGLQLDRSTRKPRQRPDGLSNSTGVGAAVTWAGASHRPPLVAEIRSPWKLGGFPAAKATISWTATQRSAAVAVVGS